MCVRCPTIHVFGECRDAYGSHSDDSGPEAYLSGQITDAQSKYNLYNLKLGDIACIDMPYLEMANRLCENCVDRLADWADR